MAGARVPPSNRNCVLWARWGEAVCVRMKVVYEGLAAPDTAAIPGGSNARIGGSGPS